MKEHGQWVELAGHDYVMDLIADLELPTDFPKHKSYFIISSDDPTKVQANAGLSVHKHVQMHSWMAVAQQNLSFSPPPVRALFGSGFDSDDELPPSFPLNSSRPAYSIPDSDGYFSHGTRTAE